MKKYKYQIVCLGMHDALPDSIKQGLQDLMKEQVIPKKLIRFVNRSQINTIQYNSPVYCVYFGGADAKHPNKQTIDCLKRCINDGHPILPIVSKKKNFTKQVPEILETINGLEYNQTGRIVSTILSGFDLIRNSRKIFISYKQDDTTKDAVRFFEALSRNGYEVFLDTHSIQPEKVFQEHLWHRMVDCDIVLILRSKNFLKSKWTNKEITNAHAMSIPIFQVLWPKCKVIPTEQLCTTYRIQTADIKDELLTDEAINKIIDEIESLYARSYASRHTSLVSEFTNQVNKEKESDPKAIVQSDNTIIYTDENGERTKYIPIIGVPVSYDYHRLHKRAVDDKEEFDINSLVLLYNQTYLLKEWQHHLTWLDETLQIKTHKI